MKKRYYLLILTTFILLFSNISVFGGELLVEAESFKNKGGWVVDQQFMDIMGSPYLMAHGMGKPVDNASTSVLIPRRGDYHIYVRTYNWTSPWHKGEGAGGFSLQINSEKIGGNLGTVGDKWTWQYVGNITLEKGDSTITLCDLTGFNGRCDAIYFTTSAKLPPESLESLEEFRFKGGF